MKRYFVIIFILALATASYAKEINRRAMEKPSTTITPAVKSYIMVAYSSAQGWDIRRMADDSVLKAGGMDTTAADGEQMIEATNTGDLNATGLTTANAGRFAFNKTLGKYRAWDGEAMVDLGDLVGATPAEPGTGGYVTAPTYSDEACTVGQWSTAAGYHYDCVATNTWNRFAYAGWTNPTPALASYSDDFGVTSDGPISANWTQFLGTGGAKVTSNRPYMNTEGFGGFYWNAATFSADHYAQATIYSAAGYAGVTCRSTAGGSAYWASGLGYVKKYVAGTDVADLIVTTAFAANDVMKLECTGTNPVVVSLFKNGTLVNTYNDSAADRLQTGVPGMFLRDTYGETVISVSGGDL